MKMLDEGVSPLGLRFLLLGLLPSAMIVLNIWGAFHGSIDPVLQGLGLAVTPPENGYALLFGTAFLLAVLLDLAQMRMTQILEGYWPSWLGWFRRIKIEGVHEARAQLKTLRDEGTDVEQQKLATFRLLNEFPTKPNDDMPTRFGNILRRCERVVDERYGHDAVVIWPRLYLLLPDETRVMLMDARNRMDLAVRLTYLFFVGAAISLLGFVNTGAYWWWFIAVAELVLVFACYHGAVSSALAYCTLVESAVDVHRFALIDGMRLPFPKDIEGERAFNRTLSQWLAVEPVQNFPLVEKKKD
jgi:hypothetical protein